MDSFLSHHLTPKITSLLDDAEKSLTTNPRISQTKLIAAFSLLKKSPSTWKVNANWQEAHRVYISKFNDLYEKINRFLPSEENVLHAGLSHAV